MINKNFISVLIALIIITSCEVNVLNERVMRKDPFVDSIIVEELSNIQAVQLKWKKDKNADCYIVMKSIYKDSRFEDFFQIYSDMGQIYVDQELEVEETYAYRLDKISRGVMFEGTEITFYRIERPSPFPGIITTQNLNNGKSAYLNWLYDAGADAYRVMRAVNNGNALIFTERKDEMDGYFIQGVTSAIDSQLLDDTGYFYRLDKQRNGQWIAGLEITAFSRTRPMPKDAVPTVNSFRSDGNIHITWEFDEGADSYILMRSFDNPPSSKIDDFVKVYEGTDLQYLDTNVNAQRDERYVYKLYKKRNGIIHTGTDRFALGVAVITQEDKHEPNNLETQATLLETFRIGNIYCYGYSLPNTILEDIDWYRVSIPPGKVVNIGLQYSQSSYSGFFRLYIPYLDTLNIINNVAFQVRNDENVQKDVTFAIIPDKTKFLTGSGTGGQVIGYTITWQSIDNN